MLAQDDHKNMGSLSKQHEKTKLADPTVHFSDLRSANFKNSPGDHAPRPP